MDENMEQDDNGARGSFGKFKEAHVEAVLSGSIESNDYCMNLRRKGRCLIFSHRKFNPLSGLSERPDADADASRLKACFKELGFEVQVYRDIRVGDILQELEEVGSDNHKDYSCFVCCILTHGEAGILYARDGKYEIKQVFALFRDEVCPTLAGKPKIFFIQASKSVSLNSGQSMARIESTNSVNAHNSKFPNHADFVAVFATVPDGFYYETNAANGTRYIQTLCLVMEKYATSMDFMQLLTFVNRQVAYGFPHYGSYLREQMPCITSTLTRNLKFPPK